MSELLGASDRVEVLVRGQDALFRLPCGEEVRATQDGLSKSKVLRQTLHTPESDGKAFLALPKGCLLAWLECVQRLTAATSDLTGAAERCRAWSIPRIVQALQVRYRASFCCVDACRR